MNFNLSEAKYRELTLYSYTSLYKLVNITSCTQLFEFYKSRYTPKNILLSIKKLKICVHLKMVKS